MPGVFFINTKIIEKAVKVYTIFVQQVFEALTKRTRNDNVATKLTRVKDSALARRIWVDKVCHGSKCSLRLFFPEK